jgi:acyl-coenzyme A thioesterase PaaI-like protein
VPDERSFRERVALAPEAAAEAPNAGAKRAFAGALREILEELDATAAPVETFEAATAELRRLAHELRGFPPAPVQAGLGGFSGMETFHDRSPIVGLANPLAPPARYEHHPDEQCVRGEVEFGKSFEGAPGIVHGGFLAALLDEVMGVVTSYSGDPGMTSEYTLRYRRPTPIKLPLRFEARFDRREGRKIFVSARLWADDTLTVTASGMFIAVDPSLFADFKVERSKRLGER